MKLKFITITGKCFDIDVDPQLTIAQIKEKIARENQLISKNLEFFLNSIRLQNDSKVQDLNIISDSLIMLHNTNQYVDRQITGSLFTPSKMSSKVFENQKIRLILIVKF